MFVLDQLSAHTCPRPMFMHGGCLAEFAKLAPVDSQSPSTLTPNDGSHVQRRAITGAFPQREALLLALEDSMPHRRALASHAILDPSLDRRLARPCRHHETPHSSCGQFPVPDDPFSFLPCTGKTAYPPVDDPNPAQTWAKQFDTDPRHWLWGSRQSPAPSANGSDSYSGRGIFLCGYLDVPLDYTNASEPRIVRLAVTKYQVSGLARVGDSDNNFPSAGRKSARTIVINPGGPGGSGTQFAFVSSEEMTGVSARANSMFWAGIPVGSTCRSPCWLAFPTMPTETAGIS